MDESVWPVDRPFEANGLLTVEPLNNNRIKV